MSVRLGQQVKPVDAVDRPVDAAACVGLLYPGSAAEDDYPWLESRTRGLLRLPLVHTSVGRDAHRVDDLLDLGSAERLADGARSLLEHAPEAVMWTCTSGSFVFGWEGARRQVDELADLAGLPVSSTSIAFVNAAQAIGVTRVAVAASYPSDVTLRFVDFLGRGGIEVTSVASSDILTAAEVGLLDSDHVVALLAGVDATGAEAVLVPDTAMHSLAWLDELEATAGKPVLTANQVTVWEGLHLLGPVPAIEGMGSLFCL